MNASSGPTTSFQQRFDYETEWWVCAGLSIPLGIFSLYIAVAQIAYCVLERTGRSQNDAQTRNSESRNTVNTKYAFSLNILCATGAVGAFMRAGIDLRFTLGRNTDLGCEASIKYKIFGYSISIFSVYSVLWLRQRIFYQNSQFIHLSSKFIKFASWSMSVVIVLGVSSTTILFAVDGRYIGVPGGCILQNTKLATFRWVILIAWTTFFQVCLLSLFVYPLLKHRRTRAIKPGDGKKNRILSLLKRATCTASICIASDIGFALIILFTRKDTVTTTTYLYDVNIVINTMCMIFSFPNWRTRLMPWHLKRATKNQESTEAVTAPQSHSSVV
uniref:uncharacterized protein LOC120339108 n=1 Tax=Styela clava TaxID=7725 RepID=UPI00193A33DB|nr:uncharacterized protein LOC120339108 [Styela clava]